MKGSKKRIGQVLHENGDFSKLQTVSKLMSRIGLLLSQCQPTETLSFEKNITIIDDIERNGYNFTDGCGKISYSLAKKLKSSLDSPSIPSNSYLPSVYQIRYKGCKGVVAL
eukprot:Awhi_evm1s8586